MAMSKGISSSQVSEITQCVICTESFKEPKVLPCIHTFCLHCLEKYGKEKEKDSGDKLDCPLCRKEFIILHGGFRELPNNYFIIQLMQLEQSSRSDSKEQSVVCDLCSELNENPHATVYCIECMQHLCQACCTKHAKPKATKDHKVVSLKDKPSPEQLIKMVPSYCEKHPSKEIEFYCFDCKMVSCYVCYVGQHNKHKCCDLNESAETLSKQLKYDIDKLSPYILRNKSEMKQIEEKKTTLIQEIAEAKVKIALRYDTLKYLLESHRIQLMSELNEFEKETLKELQTRKEQVERQFVILDSYKRYCEELKEKGTACEISRAANDLRARADYLVNAQEEFITTESSLKIDVKFKPSLIAIDSVRNWIGQVLFKVEDDTGVEIRPVNAGVAVETNTRVTITAPITAAVHLDMMYDPDDQATVTVDKCKRSILIQNVPENYEDMLYCLLEDRKSGGAKLNCFERHDNDILAMFEDEHVAEHFLKQGNVKLMKLYFKVTSPLI